MKTFKHIVILFFSLLFAPCVYAQPDLFDDEEEKKTAQNIKTINLFMFGIGTEDFMKITSAEKAGPVGNWMFDALLTMHDAAYKDAPKEYLAARSVMRKSLLINSYSQSVAYGGTNDLLCEDRKKVLEKYSLFLGTVYLDMFNMDFFLDENRKFSDVELANIYLAFIDVGRSLPRPLVYYDRDWLNKHCVNDLSNMDVLDCGEISNSDEEFNEEINNIVAKIAFIMTNLHPENVAKEATNVANTLSALPCNK